MSSHKIYGLCGLKHHIVDIRDHVTRRDEQTTNKQTMEDRATQLMEARRLSFAIRHVSFYRFAQNSIFVTFPEVEGLSGTFYETNFPNLSQSPNQPPTYPDGAPVKGRQLLSVVNLVPLHCIYI